MIAVGLSGCYLVIILVSILIQPFSEKPPIELMHSSNLWLGPLQGLVASALSILFVSKQQESDKLKSELARASPDAN